MYIYNIDIFNIVNIILICVEYVYTHIAMGAGSHYIA